MSTEPRQSDRAPAWYVFDGQGTVEERLARLPAPPPWRDFRTRREILGRNYELTDPEREAVNAALYLRRPLLVTGPPGSGKSSLAYAVARDLDLGDVLRWPINSRSTLEEGLYSYDAIARLRDAEVASRTGGQAADRVGRYVRLNALGTALYGRPPVAPNHPPRPRVLLIDEIDKSDIDLPNDLLHVLEEGAFEIPELARLAGTTADGGEEVETADTPDGDTPRDRVTVRRGVVRCTTFPFVLITSNGERDLPPAFFRRCLRLDLPQKPDEAHLRKVIAAHLGAVDPELVTGLVTTFRDRQAVNLVANDQLLNAVYLIAEGKMADAAQRKALVDLVLRELNR